MACVLFAKFVEWNITQITVFIITIDSLLIFTFFQSLHFTGLKLQVIERGAFRGLNSLRILNLGKNNLVSPPALDYISNIEDLYLYKNRITAIPKDYFRACHKLSIFDMASNHLLYLPEMSYISQSLLELKLSHNRLRSLDVLIRSNWLHLHALSVKHNNISEIQSSLIKNAP